MARRWWYWYKAVQACSGAHVDRTREYRAPMPERASESAALAALSRYIEDGVRQRLNQIDAIRAGKVTRTWEAKRK